MITKTTPQYGQKLNKQHAQRLSKLYAKYRIAENICEGKSWRKRKKFSILVGLNLADLRLYISHTHHLNYSHV